MKVLRWLLFATLLTFTAVNPAFSIVDPRDAPNNRFGIHIIDGEDLEDAALLVNSSGGEWGYVTIVIREDDRNLEKWQKIFDRMRELKLIPLVRLATKTEDSDWAKPREEDVDPWASFLASLNWVVKNRYVILFNEPNHAKEWGGDIRPDEYARFVQLFYQALKRRSEDFFILPAGFDIAATNGVETMAPEDFWLKMKKEDAEVFTMFDGWTSHAYPNPNFSASPSQRGKTSIQGYRWEMAWLKKFGLRSDLPVFIAETGWTHQEGKWLDRSTRTANTIASYFRQAYQTVWVDPQIIAITPFVLRYPQEPFDHFSWIKEDGSKYQQYDTVKELPKTKGEPQQVHDGVFLPPKLPEELIVDSIYKLTVRLKNTGQSIWQRDDFSLKADSSIQASNLFIGHIPDIKPFHTGEVEISLKTPHKVSDQILNFKLFYRNKPFGEILKHQIAILPPPSLTIQANLWIKPESSAEDMTLLIYDEGKLVKKIEPFTIKSGVGTVPELHDVIPKRVYRFVIIKPYYLPRQTYAYLSSRITTVAFKRMLPIDFNTDGMFTLADILAAVRDPRTTISLLFPVSLP